LIKIKRRGRREKREGEREGKGTVCHNLERKIKRRGHRGRRKKREGIVCHNLAIKIKRRGTDKWFCFKVKKYNDSAPLYHYHFFLLTLCG